MSLGSATPTALSMAPGTVVSSGLRSTVRHWRTFFLAICCLTCTAAAGLRAWAGPPAANLPATSRPAATAPSPRQASALGPAAATSSADPLNACERAGVAVEQASGLPPGLLLAIGRIESGRWDGVRGRIAAWPWTINAAGKGLWFTSKDDAARSVKDLLDGGTRSIDVGCFQINLMWHPTAFTTLEQAFDPDANAAYAARFLLALFSQTGSWDAAVEAYHSANPALGYAYRQQVFSTWAAAAPVTTDRAVRSSSPEILAVASRPVPIPYVIAGVQVWTPMPSGTASGVVAMPGSSVPEPSHTPGVPAQPLPAVLYHAMPPGLPMARAVQARTRSSRVLSAEIMPLR
jgi:hypothetical protein